MLCRQTGFRKVEVSRATLRRFPTRNFDATSVSVKLSRISAETLLNTLPTR